MTTEVNDTLERYTISGNGPYAFSFRIFDETDLTVTALESGELDPVAFTYGVHYSVASVNDEDGGSITLLGTTATTYASYTLDIRSNVPREQPTSIKNQGSFAPQVHETAFDRLSRQIQDLYRQVRQSFRYPDNVDLDAKMANRSSWLSRFLFVNADGEIEPATAVSGQPLTQTIIGETLYPRTQAEIDAGVTPVNYAYPADSPRRLGATGDGVTDDSSAFANMALVAAQGQSFKGHSPEDVYLLGSAVTLGAIFDFDLNGSTLKPSGNHLGFNSTVTPDVTATYTGAIATGDRTFDVVSATGLSVGQWVYFYVDLSTEQDYCYPPSWARITNIASTTITVDRAFQCDYPATPTDGTVYAFNDATLNSFCHIRNGYIDGSASTYSGGTLGRALRLVGYKKALIENVELKGWSTTSTDGDLIVAYRCLSAKCKNVRGVGNTTGSQHINLVDCMRAVVDDCDIDGSGFGISIVRADSAHAWKNDCVGRLKQEIDDSVTQRSTRGIKVSACKFADVLDNHISDYESPIKVEACHRYTVSRNKCINAALKGSYDGSIALNISNQTNGTITEQGIVTNNIVENSGGLGIGVASSTSYGKVIVSGNQVRNTQGHGIYVTVRNSIITDNQVYNWGLRNSSDNGIYHDSGTTCNANRFYHDTLTSLVCIRTSFTSTFVYTFRDNISTTNPLFTGSANVISFGQTTIASGSTSNTPSHGLIITPSQYDIQLTPGNSPTNDPGHYWVDTITSTQFTVNVRTDPGAGGASFYWRSELKQPFVAP